MEHARTLYDVLEVSQRACATVVRAAYRSLVQTHHPDKNSGSEASGDRLADINHAYSILSDPDKRLNYDRVLGARKCSVERRSADTASGARGVGHFVAGQNASRPFGFRPLD